MPAILLTTIINSTVEDCFDASRNIDLHQSSMMQSKEKAVAGVTSGLIKEGETVTWRATHFGVPLRMTVKILEMQIPHYFIDAMVTGPFKSMWHKHSFESKGTQTVMMDEFIFKAPLGVLGRLAEWLFLKKYMTNLLTKRNEFLKQALESR